MTTLHPSINNIILHMRGGTFNSLDIETVLRFMVVRSGNNLSNEKLKKYEDLLESDLK